MVLMNEEGSETRNDTHRRADPNKAVFDLIGEIEELSSILGTLMEWDKASPASRKMTIDRIENASERIDDVAFKLRENRKKKITVDDDRLANWTMGIGCIIAFAMLFAMFVPPLFG